MDFTKEVFCLGHISVDIFVNRLTLSHLRLGGTIDSQELAIHGGGSAANISFWLGKLDTRVSLIGVIGNDQAGNFLKNELEEANVRCKLKISKRFPTATILIIVEPDGERSFIINRPSQDEYEWEDLPLKNIMKGSLFYTSAYTIENPPIKNVIERLFKQIKGNSLTKTMTMFNLAAFTTVEKCKRDIESEILPYTDILVGNKDEYTILTSNKDNLTKIDPNSIGNEIRELYPNIEVILITDGRKGCYYNTKEHQGHIPAPEVKAVDTTGAGDGFCAGFIAGTIVGKGLEQSVKQGVKLGSNICQGYGARFGASKM
ncbi:MAG: carbohydrate kinase family protein [Candidatus Hodarchaeales archaeon]